MHDTINKMKKIIFSLAAVAMAAVASVNVYNVNANAVEMSDLQKENVEALANGELLKGREKKREKPASAICYECGAVNTFCMSGAPKDQRCTPYICKHFQ
jgi:hypothetical protein